MSTITRLPTVEFTDSGKVSAAEAVRVDKIYNRDEWAISVLHPSGGRVYIHDGIRTEAAALQMAADLQGVVTAWAAFSAEGT